MIEQKNEWLVVVWNDGISQFFIERLTATEEEIKRYLLSLIEDDKKLSQETCNDCTDSIDGIGSYEEPVTLEKSSKLGEQACICGEAANRLEELLQEIEISRRLEKSENHKENDDRKQLLSKNKKKMEVKKNVLKPLQSFLKSGRKIYITGFDYDEMSYVLDIDDKYLNDFVGDYTVFDLMILDANTYIAQLNFSYFILRTWKSKYHCKEVKYSLEEKGLL